MSKTLNIFMLYKIQDKDFLIGGDKCKTPLSKGYVFFSCCGKWVDIGKSGCNSGQGDKYECVFAKYLKKNSVNAIKIYGELFSDDLIVEEEGEYVLLRRKSSMLVPVSCFYSIDSETLMTNLPDSDRKRIHSITKKNRSKKEVLINSFPFAIPQKYLDDFNISNDNIDALIIQPGQFLSRLTDNDVKYRKVAYINTNCEYDIFKNKMYEDFYGKMSFNDSINKRIEMFFKDRDKYAHQCELRCVIRDESERFTTHSQSKTIHLDGLSFFNSDDSDDKNATGMDFIYSDKNNEIFAEVIMRNERDI